MDEMTVPRLYLAVDGCVCPLSAPDPAWGEVARASISIDHGHGDISTHHVRWAPRLIKTLDDLLMQYGVELVWLTSWNERDATRRLLVPALHGLSDGRMLDAIIEPLDVRTAHRDPAGTLLDDESGLWKTQRIEEDQNVPAPFIWIDNQEVERHGEEIREATPHTESLLISSRSEVGITVAEIELMRTWLEQLR